MTDNPVVANAVRWVAANTSGGPLFKCRRCGATGDPYDGFCRKCGDLLPKGEMLKRADELIERNLRRTTPRPIRGLAYIRGIGRIDLEIGKKGTGQSLDGGYGLSKLLQKHRKDIPTLAMTLVLGKPYDAREENKIVIVRGDRLTALAKRRKSSTILTHYKDERKAASFENRPVNAGVRGRRPGHAYCQPSLWLRTGVAASADII